MSNTTTYFPPGVGCFHPDGSGGWNKGVFAEENCTVTNDMLTFLNLTVISSYMAAYCLAPALDDSCPFGFCPQPDIAGVIMNLLFVWNLKPAHHGPCHNQDLLSESPVSLTHVCEGR